MAERKQFVSLPFQFSPFRWFVYGSVMLALVVQASTLVYWCLGHYLYGRLDWTVMDCLFMVVITLTTIGYGDWLQIRGLPLAEVFTMVLALVGVGVPAFVITNLTAIVVDGLLGNVYRRQRMTKQINQLRDHVIVCGAGDTGYYCVREMLQTQRPLVVVDVDEARLQQLRAQLGEFLYVTGSADSDVVLRAAGVERAYGLICALKDDKDNLFVTLSARALNPRLYIVSKVLEEATRTKLITAGANKAVSPQAIGGLRLVSELVRPSVVTFLDTMLRDTASDFRFEEVTVPASSALAGKTLAEANLRQYADVLVAAIRPPGAAQFHYHPHGDALLPAGCVVVIMGSVKQIRALRAHTHFISAVS